MFRLVKNDYIPVNWLHQHEYCEYQFFLEKIRKVKIAPSFAMVYGTKNHNVLYQEFLDKAVQIEIPLEEQIQKLLKNEVEPFMIRELSIKSQTFLLKGRIDEISFFHEKAVIIDFKPKEKAFSADKMQAMAYSLAFQDQFDWPRDIFFGITSTKSGKNIFLEKFSEKQKKNAIEKIERLKQQLDAQIDFAPTSNPKQCMACRFKHVCGHSLAE